MSDKTIRLEPFTSELAAELLPLGQACWNEATPQKIERCAFDGDRAIAIEPDLEQYQKLADLGALVLFVLREAGRARGYVLGWTYQALHHKRIRGAIADTFYVEPDLRAYAAVLADLFLKELARRDVQIVGWPVDVGGHLHEMLLAKGFVGDDIVMEKRLCA